MHKRLILPAIRWVCLFVAVSALNQNWQSTAGEALLPGVTGALERHEGFPSEYVTSRNVHVWLPSSYESRPGGRYDVIYMHDGQNLFDPKTSFIGVDWGVDEAMTRLIEEKKVREAIVVGIWNSPRRTQEYMPAKAVTQPGDGGKRALLLKDLGRLGAQLKSEDWLADRYLKFIVSELKPFIDKKYRTNPARENTFIMGSSAGALISIYAISEYPEVFGGAGGVSIHWPIGDGALIDYFKDKLPDPATHKLYFDFGTETLDRNYEVYQNRMDEVLKARGYQSGTNWITRKYEGADHSERSWRARVHVPLEFFLRPAP